MTADLAISDGHFVYHVVDGRSDDAAARMEEIHRLRYQVYVNEWGFEKPEDHPAGLEQDAYDHHSLHFYACSRTSDEVIGTARLILGSDLPLPIEQHFDISRLPVPARRSAVAEFSRLAISKNYRRRAIDRVLFGPDVTGADDALIDGQFLEPTVGERRRCEHELVRGLYLLVYLESLKLGLTHWYAVMARGLYVILRRWGIEFSQIGPERDYHGLRAPYVLDLLTLEESVAKRYPDLVKLARSLR